MTEMQAIIGRIQLRRMPSWKEQRTENSKALLSVLNQHNCIEIPEFPNSSEHAFYKLYAYVKPELLNSGWSRDRIVEQIVANGVPCYQGSCSEVYLEKAFDNTDYRPQKRLTNAKQLGEVSLMFLVHPTLTTTEIDKTMQVINSVLEQASR